MQRISERIYHEKDLRLSNGSFVHRGNNPQKIAHGIELLSELYTRRRSELHQKLLQDDELRAAYLLYFLPANLRKSRQILKEIWMHPQVPPLFRSSLRILDLGCGPGSMLLGFLDFLIDLPYLPNQVEFYAIDALEKNLEDVRYFGEWWISQFFADTDERSGRGKIALHCNRWDIRKPLKLPDREAFHFILIGNILNELFREESDRVKKRYQIISSLVEQWLAPEGFLIIMEPALKETSRDLLLLRNELIKRNGLNVYAPCVHNIPCPAVASGNRNDWCHEDRSWEPPRNLQDIDRRLVNAGDGLKYSYVVLSRQGISVASTAMLSWGGAGGPIPKKPQLWRVVSERMKERGESGVFLCGISGREKTTRLSKHSSSANGAFEDLKRGQVIATHQLIQTKPKDWRVEPETEVRILMNVQ